jgi:hypothetical protein
MKPITISVMMPPIEFPPPLKKPPKWPPLEL